MDILTFSDTHGRHRHIPPQWFVPADVIVFAGDLTDVGNVTEVEDFLNWFSGLPYEYKIFVAGNHDFCFQPTDYKYPKLKRILDEYLTVNKFMFYLSDSSVSINGIKFYGSPWQPWFGDWAFNLHRGNPIREKWNLIEKDTNVLITHGPVAGIHDVVKHGGSCGCSDLKEVIGELKDLKLHVCGHIHEGYGSITKEGVGYVNASTLDYKYSVTNKPIIIKGI